MQARTERSVALAYVDQGYTGERPAAAARAQAIDNASTRAILDLFDDHAGHCFVLWLPRYSPKLSMIEGLWGFLGCSAFYEHFFADPQTLGRAIRDAFPTRLRQAA